MTRNWYQTQAILGTLNIGMFGTNCLLDAWAHVCRLAIRRKIFLQRNVLLCDCLSFPKPRFYISNMIFVVALLLGVFVSMASSIVSFHQCQRDGNCGGNFEWPTSNNWRDCCARVTNWRTTHIIPVAGEEDLYNWVHFCNVVGRLDWWNCRDFWRVCRG